MILTVFGATGLVGKQIVTYALAKGHTVRAFGRNVTGYIDADIRNENFEAIKGFVFEEDDVLKAVTGADVVLSVLGGAIDGSDKTRSLGMKNIVAQMNKAGVKRIIAVGGMGVLNAPDETYLLDQPDYPSEYVAVGKEHLAAFQHLEKSNLDWTFVCPPTIEDKAATGKFTTSETHPPQINNYFINAGDLAHFMVDEASLNEHIKKRVGITGLK